MGTVFLLKRLSWIEMAKGLCIFFLLKLKLRDNPRYMAGEFLSNALQNLEDFKFEEVRVLHFKIITLLLYFIGF